MKYILLLSLLVLVGCGGSLSNEQKKQLKEGMEANQIKKISEAEIMDAAFKLGRKISEEVTHAGPENLSEATRRLEAEHHVKIYPLQQGDSLLLQIEQQLIEAYTSADPNLELTDNVQKIGTDSLLYTVPVMEKVEGEAMQFKYALGVRMPQKEVILSINN
ncbi:MAG: hypothetical protein KDC99_00440 [Cyclobacteriaceae bacterium]|nr:hypothetical protein [Cyclobacteriaceae bacterium]